METNNHKLILPYIRSSRSNDIEVEKEKVIQDSLRFVQNRLAKSVHCMNPFGNYPLYPADIGHFCGDFPDSLYYNRPLRYFYQRPVQLNLENAFAHHKDRLKVLQERNAKVEKFMENKKVRFAIPKRMDDLCKAAEEVHYPQATLLSAADVKKKQDEYNKLKEMIEKIGPEGQRKIRLNNRRLWKFVRKIVYFNDFCKDIKAFVTASKDLKKNTLLHVQAMKGNMVELKSLIMKTMKNIEQFACEYFRELLILDTTDEDKKENSIFTIKSFVHQLFNDLSSAFANKDDIPTNIKNILKGYIAEKSQLPPNFLTTFEFNRLEFDVQIRLRRMTKERQAMIIGFILLYRVLLLDILKNYNESFPLVREMKIKARGKSETAKMKKKREARLKENIDYNFSFIIAVLEHIFKSAFEASPKIFNDYFKNTHLYNKMVIQMDQSSNKKQEEKRIADGNELIEGKILQAKQIDDFLRGNARWVAMYKHNTFQFCASFAESVMTG